MKTVHFPYGKTKLSYSFEEDTLAGVLTSAIGDYTPAHSPQTLVKNALENPIGTPRLRELARQGGWRLTSGGRRGVGRAAVWLHMTKK